MSKILVVDDDPEIRFAVAKLLEMEKHIVETCADCDEARAMLEAYSYELVVLDWQLPDGSGIDILRFFRGKGGKTPVLMLTGKDKNIDKAAGLDSGADDYLTKPFDALEFNARVRALLRRPAVFATKTISLAGITLDADAHTVTKDGEQVSLYRREFQILEYLMRHPNRVFSHEDILNGVWPSDTEVGPDACRSAIKRLRQALDPDHNVILTVRGVGFVFKSDSK